MDVYLPVGLSGFPFAGTPRFNTTITAVAGGDEHRNKNWQHPLRRFTAPEAVRCMEDVNALTDHWLVLGGPFNTFPFRDPMDFASRTLAQPGLVPSIGPTDQVLGEGDGIRTRFQLQKQYQRGPRTYTRPVYLPLVDSVLVALNALPPGTADPTLEGGPYSFDVDRYGGEVTFDHPPAAGLLVTAGFLFDVEVRFENDDSLDSIVQSWRVSGYADLSFLETRFCPDQVTT